MPNIDEDDLKAEKVHPRATECDDIFDVLYFTRTNGSREAEEFITDLDDPDLSSLTDLIEKHANQGESENPHLFKRLKKPEQHIYEFKTHGKRASRVFCMRYKETWFLLNGCKKTHQDKGIARAAKLAAELNEWIKSERKERCRGEDA